MIRALVSLSWLTTSHAIVLALPVVTIAPTTVVEEDIGKQKLLGRG